MTLSDPKRLQSLTNFDTLLDYLRDDLNWPIEVDELDEATYAYSAEELGINSRYAARIATIKQLRPLINEQVWGIFFIEFDNNRLPVMALRRILQSLAVSRRQRDASLPAWKREDLLFICVYTSAAEGKVGQRGITFAYFHDLPDGAPELRTFSWDSRESHFYYIRNLNLSALRWPRDENDIEQWREQWHSAFTVRHRYTIRTSEKLASQMAKQAVIIRELIEELYDAEGENGALHGLYERLRIDLIHDLQPDDFADMVAQTVTYGVFSAAVQSHEVSLENLPVFIPDTNSFLKQMLETLTTQGGLDLDELGVGQLVELLQQVDLQAITRDFGRQTGSGSEDPIVHFYEQFLNDYNRAQRVQRGVFYTPDPVVNYMVRAVDEILQRPVEEGGFGIVDGLANEDTAGTGEPLVQILDPATGTGTFLAHIIDHIATRKNPRNQPSEVWNTYVAENLLKRLNGFELMMAPYTIAHLKLGLKLAQTGYTFGKGERLRVFLTNTLEKPVAMSEVLLETDYLSREANEANRVKRSKPIMVVIGNPPYSGHSANNNIEDWFKHKDYYRVDEKPLNERNSKWLNNDYVKFIRFGQWRIEQTGEGILAFITASSYLKGPIFRGMRQQLMTVFDEIYILDLHGDIPQREFPPDGSKDENVFEITQGVAVAIFVKHKPVNVDTSSTARVHHHHLWGMRESKYDWLLKNRSKIGKDGDWTRVEPRTPFYLFSTQNVERGTEYGFGWRLNELTPTNTVGVVTGQDKNTIAFSKPEAVILAKYFNLDDRVVKLITYRPFDTRYITYKNGIVTRPRVEVMRNMIDGQNLALVSARSNKSDQMNHFFCSRFITETKCGESTTQSYLIPLYIYPADSEKFDDKENDWPRTNGRRPNLSKAFVAQIEHNLGLAFVTYGSGDLHQTFGPEDIFHYAYSIFHSPTYRERYKEQLKIDFPRLPITTDVELFRRLAMIGADLVALHLLEDDYEAASWNLSSFPSPLSAPITRFIPGKNGTQVGPMSKNRAYDDSVKQIYLDTSSIKDGSYFEFTEEISLEEALATWEFQIGGYQVLHKWLYDRRTKSDEPGRILSHEDITHYQRVVVALYQTRQLMDMIDEVIGEHGGFPLPGSLPDDFGEAALDEALEPNEEKEKDEPVNKSDWAERQPKLIIADGDQLPLGHDTTENGDDEDTPYDSAVELMPLNVLSADNALTQLEGLEVEGDDPDETTPIVRPFDPAQIRMNTQQMSLDILINRMRDGRISIPRYQRAEGIWNPTKKSRLIESILIRIPLPAFYIDASDDDNWRIIDGLQRLTTMRLFVIDKSLQLQGLEFLDLNNKGYDDLPRNLQRRLEETQVTVYFVQEGTPEAVTYNIFKRINTGGEALSPQEIRNAVQYGPAVGFFTELAKSSEFLQATGNSIKPLRRADQEVVLRFFAFALSPDRRPRTNDIDAVMNETMAHINKVSADERKVLGVRFTRAMNASYAILGDFAFRKIMPSGRRGQISRALFDAWAMNFDALTDDQISRLSQKRPSSRLIARFRALLKTDDEFNRAITASTGDPARVQYRHNALKTIIQETLGPEYA